jgi:hypothetical protein
MAVYNPIRIARFWSKVDVRDNDEQCWHWRAHVGQNGYGRFKIGSGQTVHAHRVAWEIVNGQRLGEQFACHTCDNKVCVNPFHIYAGDRLTNARDAVERGLLKGRPQKGEMNGNARLTAKQVEEIRKLIADGVPNTHIAPKFGVTHSLISRIKTGRSWAA